MAYLQEHRETTGCLSLRAMVNLDELQETSKHGYFLSLAQLEAWAAEHRICAWLGRIEALPGFVPMPHTEARVPV